MDDGVKAYLENQHTNRLSRTEFRIKERARSAMMNRFYKYEAKKRKGNKMKSLTATVKKRDGAPDFVIGSFGFKAEDLVNYCNSKGYINFDILKSKEGGQYVKVSDYGVQEEQKPQEQIMQFEDEQMPF